MGITAALTLSVAPAVAVSTPALATSFKVCTASGNNFCLGASSLTDGTVITNSNPGRDITIQDQHFTDGGLEVYRLVFSQDTTKCVGFSAAGLAEVRDCSGNSNFTNWMNVHQTGATVWVNNSFAPGSCTTGGDPGADLTSNNALGTRLFCSLGLKSGDYLRWTPQPSP
jgi:hypothetical protein